MKNKIYIVDFDNHQVQIFTYDGKRIGMFGGMGDADGKFRNPIISTAIGDEIYVSDTSNHRIQVFSDDGTFIRKFGQFRYPAGIVGTDNEIYVADSNIYIVRRLCRRIW